MLTEVGKLVAISSSDGSIQWTEYLGGSSQKIIVRNMLDREIDSSVSSPQTQQIVSILSDAINLHNPLNGQLYKEYFLETLPSGATRDFIIISLTDSRA